MLGAPYEKKVGAAGAGQLAQNRGDGSGRSVVHDADAVITPERGELLDDALEASHAFEHSSSVPRELLTSPDAKRGRSDAVSALGLSVRSSEILLERVDLGGFELLVERDVID